MISDGTNISSACALTNLFSPPAQYRASVPCRFPGSPSIYFRTQSPRTCIRRLTANHRAHASSQM
ncbi:hypothetical protein C8R48DRAFT_688379, partial [Suillus tomentosus]